MMKKNKFNFISVILILIMTYKAHSYETVELKFSQDFILQEVLKFMDVKYDPSKALPQVFLQKNVNLSEYKNDVLPQWGFEPKEVTNVYIFAKNKIYLIDEAKYYQKTHRCIDDSLAHELVHYVQVMYQNLTMENFDDNSEYEAVVIQAQFREKYCKE